MFETKELKFGKKFAEALEYREIETEYADREEVKIEADIGVPCLGYLDGASLDYKFVIEYKTGKTPWDQERVNNHKQLWLYGAMIKKLYGFYPKMKLIWHETRNDEQGNIELTGKVEKFDFEMTEEIDKQIKAEATKAWEEIKNAWEDYQNKSEENIDTTLHEEYAEIARQIKELTERQAELKEKLEVPDTGLKLEFGNFYYTTRKNFEYPEEYKQKEKEFKAYKKAIESTLTPKESKSLSFKL